MEAMKLCLDNIALSGLEGCTLQELWTHSSTHCYSLDAHSKAYLWKQLLHCMRPGPLGPSVSLFTLPTVRHTAALISDEDGVSEYFHPFPYRFVTSDDGVRGSCACYSEREDVTAMVVESNMQLPQVQERFGDNLVLVASQELREKSLTPPDQDSPLYLLADIQYAILEVVGASRHHGLPRPFLTTDYLKIDVRSVFHHVKTLRLSGYLTVKVRRKYVGCRTIFTHMMYLVRFTPKVPYRVNPLYSLLVKAPYQALSVTAITQALDLSTKGFENLRRSLVKNRVIEKVNMDTVCEEYASRSDMKCVGYKLVKLFTQLEGEGVLEVDREGVDEEEEEEKEEEEEEEDEENSRRKRWPVVTELPMDVQAYRLIESYGAEGINSVDFCQYGLEIDYQLKAQLSKTLVKRKKVVSIMNDDTKIRRLRLVAPQYLKQNSEYRGLLAEHERAGTSKDNIELDKSNEELQDKPRDRQVDMEMTSTDLTSVRNTSELDAVSVISEDNDGSECSNSILRSPDQDLNSSIMNSSYLSNSIFTFNRLKRLNDIMEYMEEHQVVKGTMDITKWIREVELKEGKERVIDKKTVMKLMTTLLSEHRLCVEEVELNVSAEETVMSVTSNKLYYLPGLEGSDIVKAAKDEALSAWRGAVFRKKMKEEMGQERKKARKRKKKRLSNDKEEEDEGSREECAAVTGEGKEMVEDDGVECSGETFTVPSMGGASKFQRLRHFHYFLWILVYGYGPLAAGDDTGNPSLLEFNHTPWARVVSQLPPATQGEGWIKFNTILSHMPLGMWIFLFKIYTGVRQQMLPMKYMSYFTDPEKMLLVLHQVPKCVRECIIHANRDVQNVQSLLRQLKVMGLVELEGGGDLQPRNNLQVFLCREARILDTSSTSHRRTFFTNAALSLFTSVTYQLNDLSDLERYWFDLQSICVNTRIIISKRRRRQTGPDRQDSFPLPYNKTPRDAVSMEEFNQQGFGAGGLPPLFFSHLSRNWALHGISPTQSMSVKNRPKSSHYGPGMGLSALKQRDRRGGLGACQPPLAVDGDFDLDGESMSEDEDKESRKKSRFMVQTSTAIGELPPPGAGKKGSEKLIISPTLLICDEEERGMSKSERMESMIRTTWHPKEDMFLMLSYLTCLILYHFNQPSVSLQFINEVLAQEFPLSQSKSISALKRRIHAVYKKKLGVASNLEICVEECLQDLESMGPEAPPLSFKPLLDFVSAKYKSEEGITSHGNLPSTLTELHHNYDVVGMQAPPCPPVAMPTMTETGRGRPEVRMIADLIISILSADKEKYDKYRTFKLFENLPEEDLKAALKLLKDRNLIKSKRNSGGGTITSRTKVPIETISYDLSAHFSACLESSLTFELFQEMEQFEQVYERLRGNAEAVDMIHDAAISLVNQDCLQLDGNSALRGSVAGVLEKVISGRDMISCHTLLPHPLFEQSSDWKGEEQERISEDISTSQELRTPLLSNVLQPELSEEEEEEEGGGANLHGSSDGGVNLFQANLGGAINHGPLQLYPSLNIGALLDPLSPSYDLPHPLLEGMSIQPTNRSLNSYLSLCKEHLGFSKDDCECSQMLFEEIAGAGDSGIQRETLLQGKHERCGHGVNLQDLITTLLNFEMIYCVGVAKDLFVSHDHCGRWLLQCGGPKEDAFLISYSPWMILGSSDPNMAMLERYQYAVLAFIMLHPGVTKESLVRHFSGLLQYGCLKDILMVLECSGKIKAHMHTTCSSSVGTPFHDGGRQPSTLLYYEPVLK